MNQIRAQFARLILNEKEVPTELLNYYILLMQAYFASPLSKTVASQHMRAIQAGTANEIQKYQENQPSAEDQITALFQAMVNECRQNGMEASPVKNDPNLGYYIVENKGIAYKAIVSLPDYKVQSWARETV